MGICSHTLRELAWHCKEGFTWRIHGLTFPTVYCHVSNWLIYKLLYFFLLFQLGFVPETFRVKTVLQLNVIFIALIHLLNFILTSERLSNKCIIFKKSVKVCLRGGYGENTYRNALLPTSNAATFYVPPNSWLQKLLQIQLSCTAWGISERDHPGGC